MPTKNIKRYENLLYFVVDVGGRGWAFRLHNMSLL